MAARKKLNDALAQQVQFEFTAGLEALSQLGLDEIVASKVERMLQRGDKRATISAPPGFMFPKELTVPFKIRHNGTEIELVFFTPGGAYAYIKPPGSRTRTPAAWIEKAKAAGVLVPNPDDRRLSRRKK